MTSTDRDERVVTNHDTLCPRYRILCECADCYPPVCLCVLIKACRAEDKQAVLNAYWAVRNG
jgi:hypothetical protein